MFSKRTEIHKEPELELFRGKTGIHYSILLLPHLANPAVNRKLTLETIFLVQF